MRSDIGTIKSKLIPVFREKWPDVKISDEEILKCVNLYFDTLRDLIRDTTYNQINIANLGRFRLQQKGLMEALYKTILRTERSPLNPHYAKHLEFLEKRLQSQLFFYKYHHWVGTTYDKKRRSKAPHTGEAYWSARCNGVSPSEAKILLPKYGITGAPPQGTIRVANIRYESELQD